jgi:hypothetical protein
MPWRIRRTPAPSILSLLLAAALAATGCAPMTEEPAGEPPGAALAAAPACQADGATLQLGCPAFPNTTPQAQPDWDLFAWNSFIAANWPALDPAANNEQRGFPDLSQSFAAAAPDSLLVWETFKEKREVFFYPPGTTQNPGPWNQAPDYGPAGETIPACTNAEAQAGDPRRLFGQGTKIDFDSLDETVEVASEALEDPTELCQGYSSNPMCGTPQQADCCLVQGLPVGPRVWKGSPVASQPVVYEVKVNYDFYDYVTENQYYLDSTAATAAQNAGIRLPYRTSAASGPGDNNTNRVTGYTSQACLDLYGKVTPTGNATPCPTGAIHVKAAWIQLQDEDPSKYHTAEAAYFKTEEGQTCMASGTFGLVGLHIIQRIHQGSGSGSAQAEGGTFIFATWEHVDNDTAGFTYANFFSGQPFEGPPKRGFYPNALTDNALAVTRKFPILPNTQQVNQQVHAAIQAANPNSVWLNYQLVGTQFQAVDVNAPPPANPAFPVGPNDPTGIGQPQYLANLVIETNEGLQHFQGLPPLAAPIANYAEEIQKNGTLEFNRNTPNVAFSSNGINMGGCMGCHGVAQVKGYSFSFVLLGGQEGADIDTEEVFTVPPPPK